MIYSISILATVFFGLNFNPASTNLPTEARIYPVSSSHYRMIQPDGIVRLFELTDPKEGILVGPKPWIGVIKKRRTDIWADPKYTGGKLRTAFTFIAGRLKLMVLDGKRFTFPKPVSQEERLKELFPENKARQYKKNSTADIWRSDSSRLRLWFANPNSAGVLFAELLILCVWALTKTKGYLRVGIGILSLTFLYFLLATSSRGALLGAILGLLAIAFSQIRKWFSFKGLLICLFSLLILGSGVVISGNSSRFTNTFTSIDAGNARRLKIAKAATQMFSDAPTGWLGGEVPGRNACLNWYVLDEQHSLRTHIMSLAECGWYRGYVYVFSWLTILVLGFILAHKGNSLILALWFSFGIAGCFNPVYKDWETWIMPIISLGAILCSDSRLSQKQLKMGLFLSALLSLLAIIALITIGNLLKRPTNISISSKGKVTLINGTNPRVWVVGDPLVMGGGGFPGREILSYCTANPNVGSIAYVYDVKDLPSEAKSVIIAGRNVPNYLAAYNEGRVCKSSRLLFLSPSVGPDIIPEKLIEESKILWVAGSLLADSEKSYAEKKSWVKLSLGCERYIPQWTKFLAQ